MAFRHESNGDSDIKIAIEQLSNYVLFAPQDLANVPKGIAVIINRVMVNWLKENPGVRIRAALPITQDGQTTALHLWYDRADMEALKKKETQQ
jgi:hypothetical protein